MISFHMQRKKNIKPSVHLISESTCINHNDNGIKKSEIIEFQ